MTINYLMLVHKAPSQCLRLVRSLDAPWVHFYIHVDKKCRIDDFKKMVPESDHVHYVNDKERIDCRWGALSLVDAVFSMMRMVLENKTIGHCCLLSGQDYPLRTPTYIRDFLMAHSENNFMNVYPIPDPKKSTENGGLERLESWTFDCFNPDNPRMKAKIKPYSFCAKTIGGFIRLLKYRRDLFPQAIKLWFKRRQYPKNLGKHFNEFWCVLTYDAIQRLINVYDSRPEVREYYRYTHIPDETMFSSILCEDGDFGSSLLPMCHYVNWNIVDGGSPKTLTIEDMGNIETQMSNSPYLLFARKFEENDKVLDVIDEIIKQG